MKCEICNKDILDNSHYIKGKYYHNDCIEHLLSNWNELKEWLQEESKLVGTEDWHFCISETLSKMEKLEKESDIN